MSTSIQDAMKLVTEIEGIAKEAKKLLNYQGMPLPDPSLFGTPMVRFSLDERRHPFSMSLGLDGVAADVR